jgi:hypothetical protein
MLQKDYVRPGAIGDALWMDEIPCLFCFSEAFPWVKFPFLLLL